MMKRKQKKYVIALEKKDGNKINRREIRHTLDR